MKTVFFHTRAGVLSVRGQSGKRYSFAHNRRTIVTNEGDAVHLRANPFLKEEITEGSAVPTKPVEPTVVDERREIEKSTQSNKKDKKAK